MPRRYFLLREVFPRLYVYATIDYSTVRSKPGSLDGKIWGPEARSRPQTGPVLCM